jgi:hypothetical protein
VAEYVIVLGAESDARFGEGESLLIGDVRTEAGQTQMAFQTRYADEGHESTVPREMWVEVRGSSDRDLPEVIGVYANAAAGLLPLVAVANNAWIGDAEPKIAFDATPGATEHPHFQSFVREERGTFPPIRRVIEPKATIRFMETLETSDDQERLHRAAVHYALALGHWRPGHETLALAHLFMGMEALTPIVVQREAATRGVAVEALASELGIMERRAGLGRTRLEADLRRSILFQGDDDAATKAQKARNAFVHSFLAFPKVRELAADARDRTAGYLRAAIFDLTALDDETRAVLEQPPYDEPHRSWLRRYIWGRVFGKAVDLAAPDQAYPMLRWTSHLKAWSKNAEGDTYSASPEESMTVVIGTNARYQRDRFEVWGPGRVDPGEPSPTD